MKNDIENYLEKLYPNAKCSLNYNKDYELLIAIMLSSQTTDERVNEVTKELFKYNIYEINELSIDDISNIIKPLGIIKKAYYIKDIVSSLINNYNGSVPTDFDYLISLPGVGKKTASVYLAVFENIPSFPVDTHVKRIANRLGISNSSDVNKIKNDIENYFERDKWIKLHHQFLYFGRDKCKALKPDCNTCQLRKYCQNKNA